MTIRIASEPVASSPPRGTKFGAHSTSRHSLRRVAGPRIGRLLHLRRTIDTAARHQDPAIAFPGLFEWDPDLWLPYLDSWNAVRRTQDAEAGLGGAQPCEDAHDVCSGMCAL